MADDANEAGKGSAPDAAKTASVDDPPSGQPPSTPKPTDARYVRDALQAYCLDSAAIRETYKIVRPALTAEVEKLEQKFKELTPAPPTAEGETIEVSEGWLQDFLAIANKFARRARGVTLSAETAVVSLVARQEELFSQIATSFYSCKPEALAGLRKQIDYVELLKYSTMEEVIGGLMERELFALSSDSHPAQLRFLDDTLKLGIKDSFDDWSRLEEICARRNLYMHNGGKVNAAYLRNAAEYLNETGASPIRGAYLSSSDDYIEAAYGCMLEAGVQTGLAAIRRLFPDRKDLANSLLIDIGFEFLTTGEWALAERIFRYGCLIPPKWVGSDESAKIFLINRCIALTNLGRSAEARSALAAVDWSSSAKKFVLAHLVLEEKYGPAGKVMSRMDVTEVNEYQFRTWPLFHAFRQTAHFSGAFQKLFDKPYEPGPEASVIPGTPS